MKNFSESRKTDNTLFDLIHKYNELRSIANAIYNSDYYMIATKKEQKEIEAAAVCISKALVSAIGLEAINHDFLPDDSGNGDNRSWGDNLPDDSGDGTDKECHDAVKKMMNIAYGKTETDGVKKAAARQTLNSVYGVTGSMKYTDTDRAPSSIVAMNRENLGEIGSKSPLQNVLDKHVAVFGNDYDVDTDDDSDGDEVKDYSEVNLGNFINGPFYSDQYRALSIQYCFDTEHTLKQIEKLASYYYIQMINLVDVVDSMDEITADKYTLEPGSVFFITNKKDSSKSPVFILIYAQPYTKTRSSDINRFSLEIAPERHTKESTNSEDLEESPKTNHIDSIGSEAYFNIGELYLGQNTIIDLNATWEKIKKKAEEKGIKTITFVDTIKETSDIYSGKYSLKPGSLFFAKEGYPRFILINESPTTFNYIDPVLVFKPFKKDDSVIKSVKDNSDSDKDDIEFIGIDDYYNIDKSCPNSDQVIDLDASLEKIKERARAKNIKTITFIGTIKGFHEIFYKCKNSKAGSLYYIKNDKRPRFIMIIGTIDYVNLPQYEYIDPVVVFKKDNSEDESDSKEDDIEVVKDEDAETVVASSDELPPDYVINQYADADTSELDPDVYAKVAFPIFMKPTDTGTDVSFAQICDLYDFDISETVKRIKNAAYLENIEEVKYVDSFQTFDDIFKTEMSIRYGYYDGSLFLVRESTKDKLDPCFVILRKAHNDSYYDAYLYRINPIMRPAKIHGIKKIDIIDTYADGDVRIANNLKNLIDIDHTYKIKEICDKRKYNYDSITSCLKGVTAIIGGGMRLTFEGTVSSLNSIILVDPVVAYNTCSVFFVSNFVCCEEEAYFVIYMPITGKTKNGYNFRLYRINPILNLNQDTNTDSQDDSNVREINQFTAIYHANLEVSEADKDAYMKVEFSLINHSANGGIDSLRNICYTWKFKFYDTIKRIRLVAYMYNFKEIKYDGTACSHEEILEKEVLYSNGSVLFVSDEEDPHFVIVEFVDGSTCLNRINPVKE